MSHQSTPKSKGNRVTDERNDDDRRRDEQLGPDQGLSSAEACARLERYGPNALEEHRRSALLELLSHFWDPIPWMIEVAMVLTAVTARWADFRDHLRPAAA